MYEYRSMHAVVSFDIVTAIMQTVQFLNSLLVALPDGQLANFV